jgi:hypothetical protein
MENIALHSMLEEFSKKYNIHEKESIKFEKFVSYSLLSNDFYDSFDLEKVGTGDCLGVDAVAISLNDILVYTEQEAQLLTKGQFQADFSFIQTKTSSNLDLGDYLKFLQTVYVFFNGSLSDQPNELKQAFEMKSHIYGRASRFREAPQVYLSYVYTGRGIIEDVNFKTQIDTLVNLIREIPYVSSNVDSKLLGATALADRYKETLNRVTKKLVFQKHFALPKLSTATAAYLGVARCSDYIEILKNQDGKINKGVFYDNVRDYLGSENPVNADIADTIKSFDQRNLFSVLNNGVTVVATRATPSADVFEISGFQVVNGCQTSHVLFNNRDHVTDDMYITVKLIETDNVDLSSSVIKATNSQSVVMKEAFATIKPYHKRLEDFFSAMVTKGYKFHYERRPHQYDDNEDISADDIVSAPVLIKSFVSVVLEEPHKVHFYYGQILRDYNTEKSTALFSDLHHPALYFVSHLIAAKSKAIAIKNKLGPWSYHIAMLVKKYLKLPMGINDAMTDGKASELLLAVESGFAEAADAAMTALRICKFDRNDLMIPEKTEILNLTFYKTAAGPTISNKKNIASSKIPRGGNISPKPSPSVSISNQVSSNENFNSSEQKNSMDDGIYFVKDLTAIDKDVSFWYGKIQYKIKRIDSSNPIDRSSAASILIHGGFVKKINLQ